MLKLGEKGAIPQNDNETYGFYTLDNPDGTQARFHKFNVKTGFTEEGFVQVSPQDSLPEGAQIVIKGVYYVKSEMLKGGE